MLISHPDKRLEDHLRGVKCWGEYYLSFLPCSLIEKYCDKEMLDAFFMLHDIGKATSYFQRYISGESVEEELKSHAHLSANIFLKYIMLQNKMKLNEKIVKLMYMCIFKHHDHLSSLKHCLECALSEKALMEKQWNSISKEEFIKLFDSIGLNSSIAKLSFDEFYNEIQNIQRKWLMEIMSKDRKVKEKTDVDELDLEEYILIENLFSILIDSDKSEVGIGDKGLVNSNKCNINVKKYIDGKNKENNDINKMRRLALEEVESKLEHAMESKIYTLTLPTGMGKTLNALNFSFLLKEELELKQDCSYKIIYTLPFMSIIDQTVQVLEDILCTENIQIDSNLLLKSHHLADLEWKDGENILFNKQTSKLLIEGWNSGIIITTFIQLFETLIGYKNKLQRKYHQLNNAIIIIDEIQSLPIKYYQVIHKVLIEFTRYSNSRFLIMTATQPKIFGAHEVMSLCESEKYYCKLARTSVYNEVNYQMTLEEFAQKLNCYEKKRYLLIVNTINESKDLYNLLKEKYCDREVVLLNTNFPPIVRKHIINDIKYGKYNIIISTQMIEAGVDIDLNVVYRDFAPIPQLLQSAGRAGREGKTKGEVHIINLVDNRGKQFASYIYDATDLCLTEQVLGDSVLIEESEFINLINQYYELVDNPNIKSQTESHKLIKGLHLGKFSKRGEDEALRYAEDFKLIEQRQETISIFIELDEFAKILWSQFEDFFKDNMLDKWEKRANLDCIRRKMEEYIVTARLNKHMLSYNLPPCVNGFFYVSYDTLDYYYNDEYGFGTNNVIFF